MNQKRRISAVVAAALGTAFIVAILTACSTASPSQSPSAVSSPPPSAASPSPAASAASPSAKALSAEEQAYQKAQENWKKVVEAAQKEGEAVFYSSIDPSWTKQWEDGFNKLDPKIKVKIVRQSGSASVERLKAEAATKQYVSNGYLGGSAATRAIVQQGLTQMVDDLPVLYEPGIKWVTSPRFDQGKETITWALTKFFIIVNTNLVRPAEEPKTWGDLADPKWKDKLVFWEPRIGSGGQVLMATLYWSPNHGPDVVRKIVDNTRVVQDSGENPRMVARGEMALSPTTWQLYLPVKEAPVKMISPQDGVMAAALQAVVTKTAPQPNASKVFVNWFLGKEAQRIISEGQGAVRGDIDPIVKDIQILGNEKFLPNSPLTWDFEMGKVQDAAKVFGKWLDDAGK